MSNKRQNGCVLWGFSAAQQGLCNKAAFLLLVISSDKIYTLGISISFPNFPEIGQGDEKCGMYREREREVMKENRLCFHRKPS